MMALRRGLRGRRGAANVVLERETHPAASYPWWNAARLGDPVELRWPERRPGRSPVDAVASAVDGGTIAVAVNHVSHRTGERFGVLELAEAFPERRFALIVDAAQSAGALPLAEEVAAADFVALPAYKWLLGPPGAGFLVAGEDWLADPGPPLVGYAAAADLSVPVDPRRLELAPGADGFRLGVPSQIVLAGAAAGLELWARFGADRIAGRIETLGARLADGLRQLEIPVATPAHPRERAGVFALAVPDPAWLMGELRRSGVETGAVRGMLRADVHAYNDDSDVDRLLDALRELRSRLVASSSTSSEPAGAPSRNTTP
jgi:selenocysteine lyase/cysteine desulfurase